MDVWMYGCMDVQMYMEIQVKIENSMDIEKYKDKVNREKDKNR